MLCINILKSSENCSHTCRLFDLVLITDDGTLCADTDIPRQTLLLTAIDSYKERITHDDLAQVLHISIEDVRSWFYFLRSKGLIAYNNYQAFDNDLFKRPCISQVKYGADLAFILLVKSVLTKLETLTPIWNLSINCHQTSA